MGKQLTLHLQQNTTLERVIRILEFFGNEETDLENLADACGLSVSVLQKVVFPFLRSLSILTTTNPPSLTSLGQVAWEIYQTDFSILGEFFHGLLYTLHYQVSNKPFSWVYATVVQQLWTRNEVLISTTEKNALVNNITEIASQKFDLPSNQIAFSSNSITGVLNWLRPLEPKVIDGNSQEEYFYRRFFCSAPSLIKAVDEFYRLEGRSYGTKVLLREHLREGLCKMLILDPSGLEVTLENAKTTYDYDQGGFFDCGFEGGYGQWVMLSRSVDWLELI